MRRLPLSNAYADSEANRNAYTQTYADACPHTDAHSSAHLSSWETIF